jgi:hypothetical protein
VVPVLERHVVPQTTPFLPNSKHEDCHFLFLRPRAGIALAVSFIVTIAIIRTVALRVCAIASIPHCPDYWPISVFDLRAPPHLYYPNLAHLLTAIGVSVAFLLALAILRRHQYPWHIVALLGLVTILGTNLTQGWEYGIRRPIDGLGSRTNQYYHDALEINDPGEFFANFTHYQPFMQTHTRSHPPGAVLTLFFLVKYLRDPSAVSLAIALAATIISAIALYALLRRFVPRETAGYLLCLFLLLPAVQIYYLTSIDALIVALSIATLALGLSRRSIPAAVSAGLCLFVLSMLTFAFVFILAVLTYDWATSRPRTPLFLFLMLTFLAPHGMAWLASGFSYLDSFQIASRLENPQGYRLFAEPVSFALTRAEALAEILLFAGPFALAAAFFGWHRRIPGSRLSNDTIAAAASILLMFLAGVYRTGETARAAMFVYPFVVLPVANLFKERAPSDTPSATLLLILVFAQSLIMQLIGNYFW